MSLKSLMPFARSSLPGRELDPFFSMRRDFDRLVEDMFRGDATLPAVWGNGSGNGNAAPRIDVKETGDAIEITAELPGVDEKDVEVELNDGLLTIRGEKKIEKEEGGKDKSYYLMERSYGSFTRQIQLPYGADPEKVAAKFDKGVLKISCPKPAEAQAKSKKIAIKAG